MRVGRRSLVALMLLVIPLNAPARAVEAGATGSQPAPSTPPDPFAHWTAAVSRRLLLGVRSPPNAPKASGRVVIRFTLDRAGKVLAHDVVASSGSEAYDKAALLALAKAEPFPPIPASVDRDTVVLTQPFRFKYDPPPAKPHS